MVCFLIDLNTFETTFFHKNNFCQSKKPLRELQLQTKIILCIHELTEYCWNFSFPVLQITGNPHITMEYMVWQWNLFDQEAFWT